jgi:hypothetical protein
MTRPAPRQWSRRAGIAAVTGAVAASLITLAPPASAIAVSDEAALQAAFANPSEASITISSDIVLTCGGGGALNRSSTTNITVEGQGHTLTQSCANEDVADIGNTGMVRINDLNVIADPNANGFLNNFSTGELVLSHVTITGGAGGVAVSTMGTATLLDSHVDGFGEGVGGGFGAEIHRSSISNAHSAGVAVSGDNADVELIDSSITSNGGEGILAQGGDVTLTNSTVAGNGVGVRTNGDVHLLYATVVGNGITGEPSAVNVIAALGRIDSTASVIALPNGNGNSNCASDSSTETGGYNYADDGTCGFSDPTDQENAADPQLDPLADNGGPGFTRSPSATSPLLNAIPLATCPFGAQGITTDERGLPRPHDAGCEIGAVEVQAQAPPTTTTTSPGATSTTLPTTTTTRVIVSAAAATPIAATPAFTG